MAIDALTGPVLVATDLEVAADEALRQADALARGVGASLHVCYVLPEVLRVRMLFPQLHHEDSAELLQLERQAAAYVAQRVGAITGRSAAQYAVAIDTGSPHAGILRQAERVGAGLIVVGAGGSAAYVARGASCPVLVARPSPAGKVLGATDFSDPSLPALAAASAEARRRAVPLVLIHALHLVPVDVVMGPGTLPYPVLAPDAIAEARRGLTAELEAVSRRVGMTAECLVKEADAAQAILDSARELPAELIVVGTHGRTGLPRLVLGSVAEAVLASAACSVLVVRLGPA
jgi:nucleotide-binding universal stress UspA family protein